MSEQVKQNQSYKQVSEAGSADPHDDRLVERREHASSSDRDASESRMPAGQRGRRGGESAAGNEALRSGGAREREAPSGHERVSGRRGSEGGGAESSSGHDANAVRQRILREAMHLFAQRGFNGVSVREIVEAAGVTKPTLYYYFQSKEVLFREIIVGLLTGFREMLEAVARQAGTARERLVRIAQMHFDFARENEDHTRLTYSVYFSSERNALGFDLDGYFAENIGVIRDVIEAGIEAGELRTGDAWLMAFGYTGILNLFIMGMLYNPAVVPSEDLAETMTELALEGMVANDSGHQEGSQQ